MPMPVNPIRIVCYEYLCLYAMTHKVMVSREVFASLVEGASTELVYAFNKKVALNDDVDIYDYSYDQDDNYRPVISGKIMRIKEVCNKKDRVLRYRVSLNVQLIMF